MKKLFLFIAVVSLLASCEGPLWQGKLEESQIISVIPNGKDDTQTLVAAFEKASQIPGSVIQLGEGEYKISRIEVMDFYGTLKGAGKDKTSMVPVPGLSYAQFQGPDNPAGCLLSFIRGNVVLCDMQICFGVRGCCQMNNVLNSNGVEFEVK